MEERERLHTELAAAKQAISDSEAALARLVTAQKEREQAFTVERTQLVATIAEKESALAARAQVSPAGEALVERLRPLLPEKEAEFRATPEGLTIRFDDRVFFPSSSSSELSLDGLRSLVRVATVLRELSPGHHFAVASHVTERQVRPQGYAWILTTTRAASITAQLAKELQIEPSRLSAAAFVHPERNNKRERPRDDNNQSRSIELRIVEITR